MDPESFAEYLGSQSLLDMMANAHTLRDEDGDIGEDEGEGVDWDGYRVRDGVRGRDGGWSRDWSADGAHKAYSLST